jgi:hypothetical protein
VHGCTGARVHGLHRFGGGGADRGWRPVVYGFVAAVQSVG